MEILHQILYIIIEYSVLLFEYVGVLIIIYGGLRAIYDFVTKRKMRSNWMGILGTGLGFLLIGEILETVVAGTWSDFLLIAGIFGIRALMALLMHWEMSHGEGDAHSNK